MTFEGFITFAGGPITGAMVAWFLSSRSAQGAALEARIRALEIEVAKVSIRLQELIKAITDERQ